MHRREAIALAGFVAAAQGAGAAGALVTDSDYYGELDQPPLAPPPAVFGPVWTTLYLLIGAAAWRVWRAEQSTARTHALRWWWLQLALNAIWTPLFFGARRPGLALADIVLLGGAIVGTVRAVDDVDRSAARLLLPYAAWVAFATYLNAGIVVRNGA